MSRSDAEKSTFFINCVLIEYVQLSNSFVFISLLLYYLLAADL